MSVRLFRVLPLIALLAGCSPKIGNKCALSTDCSQLGDRLCDTNQPGGYCTVFNCEPDQCPDAICVAFDPLLDPACGAAVDGRWPRFERSYCLAACSSDGDCRNQYQCIDLSDPEKQIARSAQVVDLGANNGGLGYKVCMATTCGDGLQDGVETDVDCGGGICSACPDTKRCQNTEDCLSSNCTNGYCVEATCTNHVQDGLETDTDCGGPQCAPCPAGGKCQCTGGLCPVSADCASGLCSASLSCASGPCPGTCAPGDCHNGVQDGAETDVDCGGGGCQQCSLGQRCQADADCKSDHCTGGMCTPQARPGVCTTPILDAGPDAWPEYTAPMPGMPTDAGTD
jgi:hypothetical protein